MLKLKHTNIRDSAPWIVRNKTGARLGIEVTGELAAVIARIGERLGLPPARLSDLAQAHLFHGCNVSHHAGRGGVVQTFPSKRHAQKGNGEKQC
ncbi:hypothetical protein [Polaromonas sp. SM01]|uniref:hypothetical protein n=1 Tax=Polaromonas sp. SM01 TaxID=3085630 RepID=UPI002981D1F9|nr:hypothetical protein [Polaromonas sp. SM01]MDW5444629.1 hypothetical protein [Polaromonas sp. SM01]